jgi:hypothetical protein
MTFVYRDAFRRSERMNYASSQRWLGETVVPSWGLVRGVWVPVDVPATERVRRSATR